MKKARDVKKVKNEFFAGLFSIPYRKLVLAALTGCLLILVFPRPSLSFLVWFTLVPLLVTLYRSSPGESFLYGLLSGVIFFGGLIYWMVVLTRWAGALAILAWALLAMVEALSFAFFAEGARFIIRGYRGLGRLILIPAWWVSLEFLRSSGSWGFSWGVLGYSQQPNPIILQTAKVTGVYGISFLILLVNVLLVEIYRFAAADAFSHRPSGGSNASGAKPGTIDVKNGTGWKDLGREIVLVAAILLIVLMGGFRSLNGDDPGRFFKVVGIQGSIPQPEKWDPLKEDKIKSIYHRLMLRAGKTRPYLIIWPETAFPGFLIKERYSLGELRRLAKKLNSHLLIGSLHLEKGRQYNSAFLISPRSEVVQRYDKLHLVPFGEYVPLKSIFFWINAIAGLGEDITPGKEHTIFTTPRGKLSVVICFESANPALCREMVSRGAQMLITITNDAWFGRTAAPGQHVQITALRAVENGVYVIQVANTGISAIVDPWGRIVKETDLFEESLLMGKATFREAKTIYASFGDYFSRLCLLTAMGGFFINFLRKLGRRKI